MIQVLCKNERKAKGSKLLVTFRSEYITSMHTCMQYAYCLDSTRRQRLFLSRRKKWLLHHSRSGNFGQFFTTTHTKYAYYIIVLQLQVDVEVIRTEATAALILITHMLCFFPSFFTLALTELIMESGRYTIYGKKHTPFSSLAGYMHDIIVCVAIACISAAKMPNSKRVDWFGCSIHFKIPHKEQNKNDE